MSKLLQIGAFAAVALTAMIVVAFRVANGPGVAVDASSIKPSQLASRAPALSFIDDTAGDSLTVQSLPAGDERHHYKSACQRTAASNSYLLCLNRSGNLLLPFQATLFTLDLQEVKTVPVEGVPSRSRISPDGKYFATTSFVIGDSYAAELFSTRTVIFNTAADSDSGLNLEAFDLIINGEPFRFADTNIWGVTFVAGQDRFFATAAFNGHRYLVDGNIKKRRMVVLRDNVECPSLSPDGLRLVYKKRVEEGQYPKWRFHLLDLVTNTERPLSEDRSVDDQVAWLDDDTIMYAVPNGDAHDIWKLGIAGGKPELMLKGAHSPVVIPPRG